MNTVAPIFTPVKPSETPTASVPFLWGAQDAANGLSCVPEMQWVRLSDQREYAAGWASVKGHNETTRWFLEPKRTVATV